MGARTGNGAFGPWRAYPVLPQVPSLTHTPERGQPRREPLQRTGTGARRGHGEPDLCRRRGSTHRGSHTRGEGGEKKQQKQRQPGTVAAPGAAACGTVRGGGEPAPCSSTSNNPVHMREHLYPRTCRAEAAQQEAKKGTAKGKKEGDQGRRRERPSGELPAPRQDGRQASVHKGVKGGGVRVAVTSPKLRRTNR